MWIPIFITFPVATSFAHPSNLCTEKEVILFSCQTKSRSMSLCGSTDFMQYRYGRPNNIEIIYPKAHKRPDKAFSRHFVSWDNGSAELVVSFKYGKYLYSVYADLVIGAPDAMNNDPYGKYGNHAGVRVSSNGKLLDDIRCIPYDEAKFDPWTLNKKMLSLLPENSTASSLK